MEPGVYLGSKGFCYLVRKAAVLGLENLQLDPNLLVDRCKLVSDFERLLVPSVLLLSKCRKRLSLLLVDYRVKVVDVFLFLLELHLHLILQSTKLPRKL